jgi:hypothetical protein
MHNIIMKFYDIVFYPGRICELQGPQAFGQRPFSGLAQAQPEFEQSRFCSSPQTQPLGLVENDHLVRWFFEAYLLDESISPTFVSNIGQGLATFFPVKYNTKSKE